MGMKTETDLRTILKQIDHRGYPAYKETRGAYQFAGYVLSIDHVQGDPFAAPSKVSIRMGAQAAGFPKHLFDTKEKRIALQDELLRTFGRLAEQHSFQAKGSGKSGLLSVSRCGQEILERSACQITEDGSVIVRFCVGFPANGRTINARELEKILFDILPVCAGEALRYRALDGAKLQQIADLAEDQCFIRAELNRLGLAAFVADGAILPRESGVSGRPMKEAVPFVSPASLAVTLQLPHKGTLTGMGIPKGITVIVGGGYHGKSTLLKALERGVYPHRQGDGREYVITEDTAMKLRAEDGRSIQQVDISLFINHLPNGKDTTAFDTEDASGSTSQAAGVAEAIEAGTQTFLIDEDTSATNFMIRDELMKQVVAAEAEPITPFSDRIRLLYEQFGISTILVAGSSGAYFTQADTVIQMDCYRPVDITGFAKETAVRYALQHGEAKGNAPLTETETVEQESASAGADRGWVSLRHPKRMPYGRQMEDRTKIRVTGCDTISLNKENIDVRYVEQLVDSEQLHTLGHLLHTVLTEGFDGKTTIVDAVDKLYERIDKQGFAAIGGSVIPGDLAMPRKQEFHGVINRYRGLRFTLKMTESRKSASSSLEKTGGYKAASSSLEKTGGHRAAPYQYGRKGAGNRRRGREA